MAILTVWNNPSTNSVLLVQLSDDPQDGNADYQIAQISNISLYDGYSCVNRDYSGPVPSINSSLWRWNGTAITAVQLVPTSVTPRQVRLLLLSQNLLSQVEAIIAQSDEATKITWQYASEFRRDDPLLVALAQQLGLTDEQVDGFFISAAAL